MNFEHAVTWFFIHMPELKYCGAVLDKLHGGAAASKSSGDSGMNSTQLIAIIVPCAVAVLILGAVLGE